MGQIPDFISVGSVDDVVSVSPFSVGPTINEAKLLQIHKEWAEKNRRRNEHIFRELRKEHPNVGILMMDKEGNVTHFWETLPSYRGTGKVPTAKDLGRDIADCGSMLYLATSGNSRYVFFPAAVDQLLKDPHSFESYPHQIPGFKAEINYAILPKVKDGRVNHFGPRMLAKKGMVLGELGYWEVNVRNPIMGIGFRAEEYEKFGEVHTYIPRALVEDHPAGKTQFTPLSRLDEMRSLGRKLKLEETLRRIVVKGPTGDFITDIFFNYAQSPEVSGYQLVLVHKTPRLFYQ